jgi:ferredoxin
MTLNTVSQILLLVVGLAALISLAGFAWVSKRENEAHAARIALAGALLVGLPLLGAGLWLPSAARAALLVVLAGLLLIGLGMFALPVGRAEIGPEQPGFQVDERDIMFARTNLQPGSPEFETYYAMRPENRAPDDQTRGKPGLLSPDSQYFNPLLASAPDASFELVGTMRSYVDGPVTPQQQELSPDKMSAFIEGLAVFYGARHVGITPLQPYHVYSHIGRGAGKWGDPVTLDHAWAIALTVEMDYDMVGPYPDLPGTMETAHQYLESGRTAVQLAMAIRNLGWPARAHIDGNYRVICPLVARDAGLGEIGRMGLLMTPDLGPRVRLAVVTTDLPLEASPRRPDPSAADFCTICKKCAHNCPSRSIPSEERQVEEGVLRWQINPDTCFRYWNVIGTDCGMCMSVCPYSHPDNFYHNLVRAGIRRSGAFRRAALWLDDLFYGAKPEPRPTPKWIKRVSE